MLVGGRFNEHERDVLGLEARKRIAPIVTGQPITMPQFHREPVVSISSSRNKQETGFLQRLDFFTTGG